MNIILYLSSKKREQVFHRALMSGFSQSGDHVEYVPRQNFTIGDLKPEKDIAVFVGVKSRIMYQVCRDKNITTLLIDKGYFRNREYYRFSLGDYQPPYLNMMNYPDTRMKALGVRLRPRRAPGSYIIYAGSSHKYCAFHGLGDVNDYARDICKKVNDVIGDRKILIYRPKPSWWGNDHKSAKRIAPDKADLPINTKFSGPNELLSQLLPDCHCLITHGSTAALDALAAGVPVLLLSPKGISPAWSISEHQITNVLNPYWPTDTERLQIFSSLAWCQFNVEEIGNGLAWQTLKPWLGK